MNAKFEIMFSKNRTGSRRVAYIRSAGVPVRPWIRTSVAKADRALRDGRAVEVQS